MSNIDLLTRRARDSASRLAELRDNLQSVISPLEEGCCPPQVCIYATGSLARLEATEHSDLDAFFLLSGSAQEHPLSRIREIKILKAVIDAAECRGFPDFSNDGEYLSFLHIEEMLAHIGGRGDDYHNAFTGRILMILEGKYLYDQQLFDRFRHDIVDTYFKDFHDHASSFRPIFLLNDILRFWRTLCINYENSRHWRQQTPERGARGHLDNLKLRFSRLNICFSFICHLLAKGHTLAPEDVLATAEMTPLERLRDLRQEPTLTSKVDTLLTEYAWFADAVGREKKVVLDWIADESNRIDAFRHASVFVETMAEMVREVAESNGYLRYLII